MARSKAALVVFLALLLLAFSFNAYACLVPVFSPDSSGMSEGCPDQEAAPPWQFCQAFKTLAFQSLDTTDLAHGKLLQTLLILPASDCLPLPLPTASYSILPSVLPLPLISSTVLRL